MKTTKPPKIQTFTSPKSSNVEGGSYDPETLECVIAFRDKKNPEALEAYYTYADVAYSDWDELSGAESKGKHMKDVFTKKYKGNRIS